jgi:hypothetical protein
MSTDFNILHKHNLCIDKNKVPTQQEVIQPLQVHKLISFHTAGRQLSKALVDLQVSDFL